MSCMKRVKASTMRSKRESQALLYGLYMLKQKRLAIFTNRNPFPLERRGESYSIYGEMY